MAGPRRRPKKGRFSSPIVARPLSFCCRSRSIGGLPATGAGSPMHWPCPALADIDLETRTIRQVARPAKTLVELHRRHRHSLSEFRKIGDGRADLNVMAWAATVDASDLYLSAITLMEIELGILASRKTRSSPRREASRVVQRACASRVCRQDPARRRGCRLVCGEASRARPAIDRNAYIAATAMVHGMAVVTRNVGDFSAAPVTVLNPWISVP